MPSQKTRYLRDVNPENKIFTMQIPNQKTGYLPNTKPEKMIFTNYKTRKKDIYPIGRYEYQNRNQDIYQKPNQKTSFVQIG